MTRVAILIHGGFLRPELRQASARAVTRKDVLAYVDGRLRRLPRDDAALFRTFVYDAKPLKGSAQHSIDGTTHRLGDSMPATETHNLFASLEQPPGLTVRLGALRQDGWGLGKAELRARKALPAAVTARDLVPTIRQSGVEAAMATDLSVLALKRQVDAVVLVSGDPAIEPAVQPARREGLQVFLDPLGRPPSRGLLGCVDGVLDPVHKVRGPRSGSEGRSSDGA